MRSARSVLRNLDEQNGKDAVVERQVHFLRKMNLRS